MPGVNKATILGNLGRDPEIRSTQGGTRVASLNIATSETWRDRSSGEKREKTEWHRITIWPEHLVELVEKYVRKGDRIYIEGAIETRKWTDQSGADRFSTEIVVRQFGGRIELLGERRGGNGDRGGNGGRLADREPEERYAPAERPRGRNEDLDDEIPF